MFCLFFAYIYIKNSWSICVKRKIELFMVLFLLLGAIVASWKLSKLTTNVSKDAKGTKDKVVIVIDPGHAGM